MNKQVLTNLDRMICEVQIEVETEIAASKAADAG